MEEEIKTMQKHMAGMVRTIIDLKSKVESLEKRSEENKKDDLKVLIDKQKAVDEAIAANSAAILVIDKEIQVLRKGTVGKGTTEGSEGVDLDKSVRKCRYYDRGHCKYKCGCKYFHPKNICKEYVNNKKCERKQCLDRHPKVCKFYLKSKGGCKRKSLCDFLHVTLAQHDEKITNREITGEIEFNCVGCKSSWKDKLQVLDANWSMFDDKGDLRYDV